MAKAIQDLVYLRPAVAGVLVFVGAKMTAEYFHVEVSTAVSLGVVVGMVGGGVMQYNAFLVSLIDPLTYHPLQ